MAAVSNGLTGRVLGRLGKPRCTAESSSRLGHRHGEVLSGVGLAGLDHICLRCGVETGLWFDDAESSRPADADDSGRVDAAREIRRVREGK